MSTASQPFLTLDLGTATSAVGLVAPVDGRFRLVAAGAAPARSDVEALLSDLVRRVHATDADLLPDPDAWTSWSRLAVATVPPARAVCAAPTDRGLATLERAFAAAGWEVAGRIVGSRTDALSATEAVLDPGVPVLALAAGDPPTAEERAIVPRMGALLGALAALRHDLGVLLCGTVAGLGDVFPPDRTERLPQPSEAPAARPSELGAALRDRAWPDGWGAPSPRPGAVARASLELPDGRAGLRATIETLAQLLDRPVEAVEVGHSAGSRLLATPAGLVAHLVSADGALVPQRALADEREVDAIARWSALRADPFSLADRIRNLALAPWRDSGGDGPRLRLAALRGALARLDAQWRASVGPEAAAGADLLVVCGGVFASLPPAASALAVADTMRRPGALTLFSDHARIFGPIGALPDLADRQGLLMDLLDDSLLPIGSTVVAADGRAAGRASTVLRVTSSLMQHELELPPGGLRLIDLPPGVPARVELVTREGSLLGTRDRRHALDVTGGLGGLLVDAREVPLRLPDRAERRRAMLEAWERPVWTHGEP